jgi:hypothetical protein
MSSRTGGLPALSCDDTTLALAELDKWMLEHSYRCVDLFRSASLNTGAKTSSLHEVEDDTFSPDELKAVFARIPALKHMSKAQIHEVVMELDEDGSGELDHMELNKALRRARRKRAQMKRMDGPAYAASLLLQGKKPLKMLYLSQSRVFEPKRLLSPTKTERFQLSPTKPSPIHRVPFGGSGNLQRFHRPEGTVCL